MDLVQRAGRAISIAAVLTLVGTATGALVPKARGELVAVRVLQRDVSRSAELLDAAESVLDYGAFKVALVTPASLTAAARLGAAPFDYRVDFGGTKMDLAGDGFVDATDTGIAAWSSVAASDQLSLLQFTAPIRAEWVKALEDRGVVILRTVHPFSAIVWGDVARIEAPSIEPWLRFAGTFHPSFRLLRKMRALSKAPVECRALIVRAADGRSLMNSLEALGAAVGKSQDLDARLASIGFTIAGDKLAEVAALPGVYSVRTVPTDGGLRGEMSAQVHVGNVDGSNYALPGYMGWLSSLGLSGAGVVMANVDGGVDETHPDLIGRMTSCVGVTCSGSSSGHGTHTAGIMAGDGASGTTATSTNGDFLRGLGVAPGATLFEQRYSPTYTQPGGMLLLMTESWRNGAALSGNSWGPSGTPQGYDDDTMQVDIGVRDADPVEPGNQEFTYVLSFMNGYGDISSQGSPDEAKNLINVGSTKMQSSSTTQITAIDDLSANTAHGPAEDGRIIPHIVAPGCSVDSTTPGSSHGLMCGTSMASPHVAGTVALYIEQYRADHGSDPSPALIKAALLATARSLEGNLDADGGTLGHPFDSKQGWGRAGPATLLAPPATVATIDQDHVFDGSGGEIEYTFDVDDPSQPVRVMLVWTDAPGHGLGGTMPAWNNDLDLEVDTDAVTYLGNVFGLAGWSVTGSTADGMNNTEGVLLDADPGRTSLTVRVRASDVASDGIPGNVSSTDQDFALYCLNCVSVLFADGFESGDTAAWSP